MKNGTIISIRGVVVDVQFPEKETPKIYDALEIDHETLGKITLEVEAILEPGLVRTVAMGSVFGLNRGLKVSNTGESIKVPVGEKTLGRLYNVLGEEIDELGKTDTKLRSTKKRAAKKSPSKNTRGTEEETRG